MSPYLQYQNIPRHFYSKNSANKQGFKLLHKVDRTAWTCMPRKIQPSKNKRLQLISLWLKILHLFYFLSFCCRKLLKLKTRLYQKWNSQMEIHLPELNSKRATEMKIMPMKTLLSLLNKLNGCQTRWSVQISITYDPMFWRILLFSIHMDVKFP